jgi:hypothetical protein
LEKASALPAKKVLRTSKEHDACRLFLGFEALHDTDAQQATSGYL